jgi:hypothetical protein
MRECRDPRPLTGFFQKPVFKALSDRKFFPYLHTKNAHFIEEGYRVRVEFNDPTAKTQVWTFDDLADWTRDRKLPKVYAEVLQIAISLEQRREEDRV